MAERKRFEAQSPQLPSVRTSSGSSPFAAELQEFGNRMFKMSGQLIEQWVQGREREEWEKGSRAGADGTFTPARGGSRADESYNLAGFKSYSTNLKIQMADDIERVYERDRNDPALLESSIAGLRDGYESEISKTMPELLPDINAAFDRTSRPFRNRAAEDWRKQQLEVAGAELKNNAYTQRRQAETRALYANPAPGDVKTYADLALDRGGFMTTLDEAQKIGALTPEQAANELRAYDFDIKKARVRGSFDRAVKAGRGEKFVQRFSTDKAWVSEENFSFEQRDAIAGELITLLNRDERLRTTQNEVLKDDVRAHIAILNNGDSPANGDALRGKVAGIPELSQPLEAAYAMQDRYAAARQLPPGQQRAGIAALENKSKAGGLTLLESNLLERLKPLADQTEKAIATDGLSWGIDVGLVPQLPPLLDEAGNLNAASMEARIKSAAFLTKYTGRQAAPITKADGAELVNGLLTGGVKAPSEIMGQSGEDGRAAMKAAIRMFEGDYPQVAQVATYAMNQRVSPDGRDVASLLQRGYALTARIEGKPPLFSLKAGQDGKTGFEEAFNKYTGDSFIGNAAARGRAEAGVMAVYAALAENSREGLNGSINETVFNQAALDYFGGNKIKVNGGNVFPPYGMGEDEFRLGLATDARVKLSALGYADAQIEAIVENAAAQHTADGYMLINGDSYVPDATGAPLVFQPVKLPPGAISNAGPQEEVRSVPVRR